MSQFLIAIPFATPLSTLQNQKLSFHFPSLLDLETFHRNTSRPSIKFRNSNSLKIISCQQAFYDLPTAKMERSAGFGYGTKFDFTKSAGKVPAPDTYNIQSIFENTGGKVKGLSIGVGREVKFFFLFRFPFIFFFFLFHLNEFFFNVFCFVLKNMKNQGIFYRDPKVSVGPGSYDFRPALSNIKYTMRPKTNLDFSPNKKFPGPGTYDVFPSISKDGKYSSSKFKASGASNFNPPSSKRFDQLDKSKFNNNFLNFFLFA